MRIAALDIGQKRIGIALSDEMQILAQGIEVYQRKGVFSQDCTYLSGKLDELQAKKVIIGLPIAMDGTEGIAAKNIRSFAEGFSEYTNIPIEFYDERLTTAYATRALIEADVSRKKRKQVVDKMAAQLILQGYLDTKGGETHA